MPASELQKKVFFFAIFAAICAVPLVFFKAFREFVSEYLLTHNWSETAVGIVDGLLRVVMVILAMALVVAIVRFLVYLFAKTVYRNAAPGEISSLLRTVLSVIVYIVAFFIIFQSQFPTVELTALFTGSTIVGIVVGLALQDTLGNLFAGLAIQADQPFVVGDVVLIPGRGEGVVEAVSWRGVKIRTFQNKLLVVSNSVLGKEIIEVAPKTNLNAKLVFFNTLYTHSPSRTAHIVREAVRQAENVSQKIRPVVRMRNLAADGIDWEVKYWMDDYTKYNDTDALIRQRIWYAFQREKIDFAYPTRTLYMEQKPEEAAPEEIVNKYVEHLNRVSIFAPLSEEEIERLANASTSRTYAPGEAIVRRGQEGTSMFVIISGGVKVQIPEKNYQKTINTLKEFDYFGEMSLLTGEPRTATVIATEETEVLRIDKNGLKPIFEHNPSLVASITEMIEERRALLRQQAEAEALEQQDETRKGVMKSIRKFFGLR
jgi:small-conductance mechanosensitive channel/CRP-like cAMP-binding protein